MSSLVNFFDKMNINESGGNTASRTSAAPAKPQRRFGVSVPKAFSASKYVGSKRKPEPCIICLQNCVSASSMKPDGCDHAVCDTCLCTYYQTALNDARYRSFEHIQCPSPDCEALFVSKKVIRNIFTVEQQNDWWVIATTRTFIENKVYFCISVMNLHVVSLLNIGRVSFWRLQGHLWCRYQVDKDMHICWMLRVPQRCMHCLSELMASRYFSFLCNTIMMYNQKNFFFLPCVGVIKILNDEEELKKTLREAKEKSWTRCPKCQNLIERKVGMGSISYSLWCWLYPLLRMDVLPFGASAVLNCK